MNREDIIKLALESDPFGIDGRLYDMACVAPETLERFARLIAEDCAKRCEAVRAHHEAERSTAWSELTRGVEFGAEECAAAIREAYNP